MRRTAIASLSLVALVSCGKSVLTGQPGGGAGTGGGAGGAGGLGAGGLGAGGLGAGGLGAGGLGAGGLGAGGNGSGTGGSALCPNCDGNTIGGDAMGASGWNPTTDNSNGVVVDGQGNLTLAGADVETLWVWIANSSEGTVSKLDPTTGRELARYPAAVTRPANNARPWNERCDQDSERGNCPSRTAVDFQGNAWVANRAFGNQGTVTKIAGKPEHCDMTGGADGVFRTSTDANGDGRIDPGDPAEFLGDDDDCVLLTVDVGTRDAVPRALAVAPNFLQRGGSIWVGLNKTRKAVELDSQTGAVLGEVDLPLNPYGALAAKRLQVVWFTNAAWQRELPDNPPAVVSVFYANRTVGQRKEVLSTTGDCPDGLTVGTYGIGVDKEGRVWVGAHPCTAAFRYDPMTDTWMTVNIPGVGPTRGIVVDGDDTVWVGHWNCIGAPDGCGKITRFSAADGTNMTTYDTGGKTTIGVDFDRAGNLWGVNQATNNVVRINPQTGATDLFPVGDGPYTYSDFTGHSLRLQFAPGAYQHVFSCGAGAMASWVELRLDADIPAGTRVETFARTADTAAALRSAPWVGPWGQNPVIFQLPPGPLPMSNHLEIKLELSSDGEASPKVRSMTLFYQCQTIPG